MAWLKINKKDKTKQLQYEYLYHFNSVIEEEGGETV